jgi:hypothetical protein
MKKDSEYGSVDEIRINRKAEVLGVNLPQSLFPAHIPPELSLRSNPGQRGEKPATNRLISSAA